MAAGVRLGANFEVLALSPGPDSKLKAPTGSVAKNNSYNVVGVGQDLVRRGKAVTFASKPVSCTCTRHHH